MNIEVELVTTDEKNGCACVVNVERKDVESIEIVENECKSQVDCTISDKVDEEGNKMSESTTGINKRRHSETEDENISTVKKSKHEKMEVAEINILEKDSLKSDSLTTGITGNSNKSYIKIEATTESINEADIVASSSDDHDDLLDRLDAIDSSGLRSPDLKLEDIDTTDLEKDDLLKRLEEAEGGSESEPIAIQNTADDQILINEDLLLDGEISPAENEELEQPSSTNADAFLTVENDNEKSINMNNFAPIESNVDNTAESSVLMELNDEVSDTSEANEKCLSTPITDGIKSEVFTVDSTDEQMSTKIDNATEEAVDNVDSTNEKLTNFLSEVPSTSFLSSTTANNEKQSKIKIEMKINPNEEKITNHKPDKDIETCVDSTNKDENKPDITNDNPLVVQLLEITVDSTNAEIKSEENLDIQISDSKIKPPDSTALDINKEISEQNVKCNVSECNDAIISTADSLKEESKIAKSPIKLSEDNINIENIEVKSDNIPLYFGKVENNSKPDIIKNEDVLKLNLIETSEAQPAVEDLLKSNKPIELEKEAQFLKAEILNTVKVKSENVVFSSTLITSEITMKENSEAQPLLTEKQVECKITFETPCASVTSSSKEDSPSKSIFEGSAINKDTVNIDLEEPPLETLSTENVVAKSVDLNLKDVEKMDVDENLLADNEAADLCEQVTVVVIDCDNDEEITSNVNENDAHIKSTNVNMEDAAQYSDSTASINSTSEEALINYNKETHLEENDKCDGNLNMSLDSNNPKSTNKDKLFGNVMLMNNGSSTPNSNNTSVTTSNVFNSTPILKNFEITSENVSKISDNTKPCSSRSIIVLNDDTVADTTEEEGTTLTENETQSSSDGITNFAKSIIQLNGLSLSSSPSEEIKNKDEDNVPKDSLNGLNLDLTNESFEDESLYEVGIFYEENDMKYLVIEKLDRTKKIGGRLTPASSSDVTGNDSSDKRSSNGSVGSIGLFTLPQARLSAISSNSSSSMSQKSIGKFAIPALPQRNKQTIKGMSTLCNFMIDHFSKIKASLNQSHEHQESLTYTPKGRGKETTKKSLVKEHGEFNYEEKFQSGKGNKRKADTSNDSVSTTDDEKTPKSKVSKKTAKTSNVSASKLGHFLVPPSEVLDDAKIGLNVLARWIDKKYYAGKVVESKPGMKYVIKFEDGALKTLPQDLIVFGRDENILPLLGHQVHALVENDEYEIGYVQESEIENGVIYYNISIDSNTIRVTSSDIYLTDEQAKSIQDVFKNSSDKHISDDTLNLTDGGDSKIGSTIKGRPHRSVVQKPEVIAATTTGRGGRGKKGDKAANETEAGFSGGIAPSKRGRKPKRPQPQSESSDVSDSLELDSAPNSPDSALEAINGVQPELQKTPKESQINKMCIMAEYLGTDKPDKNKNLEDLLGPIPNNKSLFRNKHFILTCTIAMKTPRPSSTKKSESPDDMKNKYRTFTSLPFIKEHLRKQIEEGGGKVYNHFEDIPKNKYKQCKLISPSPCVTAKYVQCLAAEIPAISHEWIIESCRNNLLVDTKLYALPSGWSLIEERYIKWAVGRNPDQRSTSNPLSNQIVLMASQNKDFSEFWTRVCKLAGSTIRVVKTATDITQGQTGCMLTDEEFPQDIKSKAEHFGIPIVSTVWVVQSLILGKVCRPDAHEKLTQIYQDDDY